MPIPKSISEDPFIDRDEEGFAYILMPEKHKKCENCEAFLGSKTPDSLRGTVYCAIANAVFNARPRNVRKEELKKRLAQVNHEDCACIIQTKDRFWL